MRVSGSVVSWLCVLLTLLVGCGDYCLFCDGQGGGGGNGGETEEICDSVFSGVADYQAALNINTIQTFTETRDENDRLSIAVVPKGMSFDYGSNLTANPGYVIVANQLDDDMFVFDEPGQNQTVLLSGFSGVSGVALLRQQRTDETYVDLLFFTVETNDELYVHDLAGSESPSAITNEDLNDVFTEPGDFFESPTAISVSGDSEEAIVFIVNDNGADSSVRRLHVDLDSLDPNSARTIATNTVTSRPLRDIAYFAGTDALFVSKRTVDEIPLVGWVHRISDAADRTSQVVLDTDSGFIQDARAFSGLTVAFTNAEGTTADLLVLREVDGSVEQYDTVGQGTLEGAFFFGATAPYPGAVAYDCTNERILVTNIPFDQQDSRRPLLEALPTF